MNQQEILEGNKLIVLWMGYKSVQSPEPTWKYWWSQKGSLFEKIPIQGVTSEVLTEDGEWVNTNLLKYHSSWDWLMPVVEKIENFNASCTLFIIEDERCHINSQNGFEIDSVGHTKIEAVYNATISFLKWYNENKNK